MPLEFLLYMNKGRHIAAVFLTIAAIFLLNTAGIQAQNKVSVSGVVTDSEGGVLIGAAVRSNDGKTVVITDIDGKYKIEVSGSESSTLTFSYLGMAERIEKVGSRRTINVSLSSDSTLESAVIVGAYGTIQRREDLTGSAFQINSDLLVNQSLARVDTMLEGLIPGLTMDESNDTAGSTRTRFYTRIRGEGSLSGSSEPLWVIDGVPQYTGNANNSMPGMSYTISPLSYLNPDDIESVTVLKDADQVSIYGANGANGVILITTKQGRRNTPLRVNASLRYGVATIDRSTVFKAMNAAQYMEVAKEAWVNSGKTIENFPFQDNEYNSYSTTDTNWPELYFGLGDEMSASLSINYGTQQMSGRVSGSFYRKDNVVKTDNQQRFTLSTRNDFAFGKKVHFIVGLNASYNNNNLFSVGSSYIYEVQPIFSPYLNDGTTYRLYNQIWDETKNGGKGDWTMRKFTFNGLPGREYDDNIQRTVVTDGNFQLSWEIVKGLNLRNTFGFKYNSGHEDQYTSRNTLSGMSDGVPVGWSSKRDVSYMSWSNNTIMEYNRTFAQKYRVKGMAGLELVDQLNKYSYISGSGFMNDNIKELEYADNISQGSWTNSKHSREMSYFGRVEFGYDSRYNISGNIRRNGNSIFGKYSKWGTFWSVGTSWNIHKEHFFNVPAIKALSLKASYGKAGSSKIDATTATGTYLYSDAYSYMGSAGALVGSAPNPGLSWETTWQFNTGLRTSLACGLDFEVEYYNYLTTDLLSKVYVSRTITEDRVYANLGSVRNQGIEVSVDYDVIRTKDWNWNIHLNAAHNSNRIEKLYNGVPTSFGSTIWMEGQSTETHMLIRWAGVDPLDGSPLWYDKNGSLTKTYDYNNRVPCGTPNPDVSGGMHTSLRWKGLTLSAQLKYMIGGLANPGYGLRMMGDGYDIISGNQAVEVYYYRWKQPGDLASFPKVNNNSQHSLSYNNRLLMSRTNFSLNNITLSYQFPDRILNAMKVRDFGLSLICDNVYLFCPGMDAVFNSYKTMKSGYPSTRTYTLALSVSF